MLARLVELLRTRTLAVAPAPSFGGRGSGLGEVVVEAAGEGPRPWRGLPSLLTPPSLSGPVSRYDWPETPSFARSRYPFTPALARLQAD